VYQSLILWFLFTLPGYVLLRRASKSDLQSGLLGTLAVSNLYTLVLFSPVCLLCYVCRAPIAVFSISIAAILVLAVLEITRRRWWADLGRMFVTAASFELLVLATDLVLGARKGALFGGDARVHLARIRFLLDNGFNNLDPFVEGEFFFPIYHTNILHGLIAAMTQICRADMLEVWYTSLPWAKLMLCSGAYYMAWSVFQSRWPAWAAALCCLGVRGPFNYVMYPNQLSPFWLTPMMIGLAAQTCRLPLSWAVCLKLAGCSFVTGQLHGLYVLFAIMALGPSLALSVLVHLVRRRRMEAVRTAACALAMFTGLPFLYVSKSKTPAVYSTPKQKATDIIGSGDFVRVSEDWVMRDPRILPGVLGGPPWRIALFAIGVGAATWHRRSRWPSVLLLGTMSTTAAILFVPPVCSAFLRVLREEWILERFGLYFGVIHFALIAGALALVFQRVHAYGLLRVPLSIGAILLGVTLAGHQPPYDWVNYLAHSAGVAPRPDVIKTLQGFRAALAAFVPRGAVVLTDLNRGIDLVALHDCRIVASGSASNGVPDWEQRKRDVQIMMSDQTPPSVRLALLRKYHVQYLVPSPQIPCAWAQSRVKRSRPYGREVFVELAPL